MKNNNLVKKKKEIDFQKKERVNKKITNYRKLEKLNAMKRKNEAAWKAESTSQGKRPISTNSK